MDVVVVGSVNADLVVRVARRPAPGETVMGSDLDIFPGGKGANQAVAAARLGAHVALLARTGTDQYGTRLAEGLAGEGVDTGHVLPTEGAGGVALITVDADGDNSIIVSPGANARLSPEDVVGAAPLLEEASVVSLMLEIPLDTVTAAARAARRVLLNASPPRELPAELLSLADPLVVNEHEAAFLLGGASAGRAAAHDPTSDTAGDTTGDTAGDPTGRTAGDPTGDTARDAAGDGDGERGRGAVRDAAGMARDLLALGPRSVVVTLGADGAVVAEKAGAAVTAVPSPAVEAVDTTGAGDAFTGALAWRLARGDGLPEAAAFAARVGAAAVRREGAQSSYPRLEEL
ncbi:ribokinase [Nonomuraea mangrovi]|uniref:Ribokinase n=1 Tax=Nonomuraea mangrovi TaxID=2316207 RepID=A0ABW4SXL8_9ACTN